MNWRTEIILDKKLFKKGKILDLKNRKKNLFFKVVIISSYNDTIIRYWRVLLLRVLESFLRNMHLENSSPWRMCEKHTMLLSQRLQNGIIQSELPLLL